MESQFGETQRVIHSASARGDVFGARKQKKLTLNIYINPSMFIINIIF